MESQKKWSKLPKLGEGSFKMEGLGKKGLVAERQKNLLSPISGGKNRQIFCAESCAPILFFRTGLVLPWGQEGKD